MRHAKFLYGFLILCVGLAGGYFLRGVLTPQDDRRAYQIRRAGQYRHVNPLLECDIADDVLRNRELVPFKHKVEEYLTTRMDKRWAAQVSIYFRELNDGLWFSIGETEHFVPASLRKLPLMIALLKMAEQDRSRDLLAVVVKNDLATDYNAQQNIRPARSLESGKGYSVRELIERMIIESDNNAFTLLARIVDPQELARVYATLRVQSRRSEKDDEFLSVQTYASFFRILYNATYLSKEASDWALTLLARSEFKDGLVAGVPQNVEVAHKFGEKSGVPEGMVQLHDCGIVYVPRHPYLLCVMSRGPNFEYLDDVIVNVSRLVFEEVARQHQGERHVK